MFICLDLLGVRIDEVGDVYILGHSMGDVDFEYFRFFADFFSGRAWKRLTVRGELRDLVDRVNSYDDSHLRVSYAVHKYGKEALNDFVSYKEKQAIKRYLTLQNIAYVQEILESPHLERAMAKSYYHFIANDIDRKPTRPLWHISCHNKTDAAHVAAVMKKLNYKNYKIYRTIEECARGILMTD